MSVELSVTRCMTSIFRSWVHTFVSKRFDSSPLLLAELLLRGRFAFDTWVGTRVADET